MTYIAAAEEKEKGESSKYDCSEYIIRKGDYAAVTLRAWRDKTDQIKVIFEVMLQDNSVDHRTPSVEWYKDDHEMVCMMKLKT